jgi:hypothetical protein
MAVAASYTRCLEGGWDDGGILKQGRLEGVDTTMTAMATATVTATATATGTKWWRSDLIIKLRRGWSPAHARARMHQSTVGAAHGPVEAAASGPQSKHVFMWLPREPTRPRSPFGVCLSSYHHHHHQIVWSDLPPADDRDAAGGAGARGYGETGYDPFGCFLARERGASERASERYRTNPKGRNDASQATALGLAWPGSGLTTAT